MLRDSPQITWVLEENVFADSHARLRAAVIAESHRCRSFDDCWLAEDSWPRLAGQVVVFHGSLGAAAAIRERRLWTPGAWCDVSRFHCSCWYDAAKPWLLNRDWLLTTVGSLVADPEAALRPPGPVNDLFVRPDSPLKPFSGRVVRRDSLSLAALDHGFYYDDTQLPIIVAPARPVGREWRFVVVENEIVAGSEYVAAGRKELPGRADDASWLFAASVARQIQSPEAVYVLDVCEADGKLHLLELNPFSGADLYACDRTAIVRAVTAAARLAFSAEENGSREETESK